MTTDPIEIPYPVVPVSCILCPGIPVSCILYPGILYPGVLYPISRYPVSYIPVSCIPVSCILYSASWMAVTDIREYMVDKSSTDRRTRGRSSHCTSAATGSELRSSAVMYVS